MNQKNTSKTAVASLSRPYSVCQSQTAFVHTKLTVPIANISELLNTDSDRLKIMLVRLRHQPGPSAVFYRVIVIYHDSWVKIIESPDRPTGWQAVHALYVEMEERLARDDGGIDLPRRDPSMDDLTEENMSTRWDNLREELFVGRHGPPQHQDLGQDVGCSDNDTVSEDDQTQGVPLSVAIHNDVADLLAELIDLVTQDLG